MTIVAGKSMQEELRARRELLQERLTRLERAAAQEGGQLDTPTYLSKRRAADVVKRELNLVTAALTNLEKHSSLPSRRWSEQVER